MPLESLIANHVGWICSFAGFKAGSGIAHCLINRTGRDAVYFEVGTRAKSERVQYPDVDFVMERDENGRRFFRKSGEPIGN